MPVANVVRMRVKPGEERRFLDTQAQMQGQDWAGLRSAYLAKVGERDFVFVGEWDDMDALAAARPRMVAELDRIRDCLEDRGGDMGVTDPQSGEIVLRLR